MTDDKNIVKNVWNFLDRTLCIGRNISNGLINIRGLAKYLIKEEKIDATLDTVVSAIRRYNLDAHGKIFSNARKSIQKITAISTRSPLANISVAKDAEVQNALPKLFSIIHYNLSFALTGLFLDKAITRAF